MRLSFFDEIPAPNRRAILSAREAVLDAAHAQVSTLLAESGGPDKPEWRTVAHGARARRQRPRTSLDRETPRESRTVMTRNPGRRGDDPARRRRALRPAGRSAAEHGRLEHRQRCRSLDRPGSQGHRPEQHPMGGERVPARAGRRAPRRPRTSPSASACFGSYTISMVLFVLASAACAFAGNVRLAHRVPGRAGFRRCAAGSARDQHPARQERHGRGKVPVSAALTLFLAPALGPTLGGLILSGSRPLALALDLPDQRAHRHHRPAADASRARERRRAGGQEHEVRPGRIPAARGRPDRRALRGDRGDGRRAGTSPPATCHSRRACCSS